MLSRSAKCQNWFTGASFVTFCSFSQPQKKGCHVHSREIGFEFEMSNIISFFSISWSPCPSILSFPPPTIFFEAPLFRSKSITFLFFSVKFLAVLLLSQTHTHYEHTHTNISIIGIIIQQNKKWRRNPCFADLMWVKLRVIIYFFREKRECEFVSVCFWKPQSVLKWFQNLSNIIFSEKSEWEVLKIHSLHQSLSLLSSFVHQSLPPGGVEQWWWPDINFHTKRGKKFLQIVISILLSNPQVFMNLFPVRFPSEHTFFLLKCHPVFDAMHSKAWIVNQQEQLLSVW